MECPSCKGYFEVSTKEQKFCPLCGVGFPLELCEELRKTFPPAVNDFKTPPGFSPSNPSLPEHENAFPSSDTEASPSSDPGARAKEEYATLLREVFSSGRITPEDLLTLARRKKALGIDNAEAIALQKAVAGELGLNLDEERDCLAGDLLLEVNIGQTYRINDGRNLEFRLTNVSDDDLYDIKVIGSFLHLGTEKVTPVRERRLAATQSSKWPIVLDFRYDHAVMEIVRLTVVYNDARNNPSVYETQLEFEVFEKTQNNEGNKSISINFQADKIFGNDMSKLAEIAGRDPVSRHAGPPVEGSFLREQSKQWHWLPLCFNEEETNRRRNEILIRKKLMEGADHFRKAVSLREEVERGRPREPQVLKESLRQALEAFEEAHACFIKIREIDPAHAESLSMLGQIEVGRDELLAKIRKIDDRLPQPPRAKQEGPKTILTSALITLSDPPRKIFLYSKPVVTLGKNSGNDLVLRLLPYQPETEYPENYKKSLQISGYHAEIINEAGQFYLRDIEKNGRGSLNGTFLDGRKVGCRKDQHPLRDGCRINIANVLELGCQFLWNTKKRDRESRMQNSCMTVLGDVSDSCFGINKQSPVNAIRIVRINNLSGGEEYLIVIREATIGRSTGNGIVIDRETVSDIHAKLFFRDDRYWIEDLNSRHGTTVNGAAIEPGEEIPLDLQASIAVGGVSLEFTGRS